MPLSRRQLLESSLLGCLATTLPLRASTAAAQTLNWVSLGEGLAMVQGVGSNVLVNWGNDGIALIDGGHADYASVLLKAINDNVGGVPELLFNSHCHRDQIGCNAALGVREATIIAHENTRLWLTTEIISRWEDKVYPPVGEVALPNKTFIYDDQLLDFNEPIEYALMKQAHTDGDIYVFLPERNILFAGGVLSPGAYPLVDFSTNGWVGGIVDGLNIILNKTDNNTRIFASTGNEVTRADVEAQRDMVQSILGQMGTNVYQGGTFEEFIASNPSADFDDIYGDPRLFLYTAYKSVWGHQGDVRRYGR